jgi:RNA polymerase sigma-70 factor (ECF subfamily)
MFAPPSTREWLTLVNGTVAAVVISGGHPISIMGFTVTRGKITEINVTASPDRLLRIDAALLED